MVTRMEVLYAYRLLLGREPESEAVIEDRIPVEDWQRLRDLFMKSKEFWEKSCTVLAGQLINEYASAEPNKVDVNISEEHFTKLLGHVQRTWEALGAERPYWSVLVSTKFLPENFRENLEEFYASGLQSWRLFERAAARGGGREPSSSWTAFELGCGVGRVTIQLAKRFRHVVAYDISRSHLDIAGAYLSSAGVTNVTLSRLEELDDLFALKPFDFFYSVIVLQHNPPPLMHRMLQIIFEKLRPGGLAYFQIPVAGRSYEFSILQYLEKVKAGSSNMEMHVLPQPYLFQLLQERDLRILDLQRDNWAPPYHSISVLAEKTA